MDSPLFWEKGLMTVFLLIITAFFSFLPWLIKGSQSSKWRASILSLCTCLAGGVIVGSLLFHLIPETLIHYPHCHHDSTLPFVNNETISVHHNHTHCHHFHEETVVHMHSHHISNDEYKEHSHEERFQWGSLAFGLSFFGLLAIDRLFLAHRHCSEPAAAVVPNQKSSSVPHTFSPSANHNDCKHNHTSCGSHGSRHHIIEPHQNKAIENPDVANSKIIDIASPECHSVNALGGCHVDGLEPGSSKIQSLFFVLALSVHSFVEGLAVQSICTMPSLFSFIISLFSHKCLEALALGINVYKAKFSMLHSILLCVVYSLLTPFGIMLSILLQENMISGPILGAIFNGMAAGSFLFVAVVEMIIPELHTYSPTTPAKFVVLLCGFFGMAAVSLLPHTHTH